MASDAHGDTWMTLPLCRYRDPADGDGPFGCSSPNLIVSGKVTRDICLRCPYADKPESEALKRARARMASSPPRPMPIDQGPGTELTRLLAAHGITEAGCQCKARANEMNYRGPDWCAENIETIVDWLAEAAKERGWPIFSRLYARWLVRQAIRAAR